MKPDTKRRRKKAAEDFSNYLTMKTGFDLEYFVDEKNTESARDLFTETLRHYFWSYQVKVLILFCFEFTLLISPKDEDGTDRSPRLGTLIKVRSLLKCELIQRLGSGYNI